MPKYGIGVISITDGTFDNMIDKQFISIFSYVTH